MSSDASAGTTWRAFNTFVFFDLETTGLSMEDCKITEICLCAVSRSALLERPVPRILDKLNLCLDPETEVDPEAAELTGLSRQLLQHNLRGTFTRRVAEMVRNFLEIQASPTCLVAHNGYRFDFPILARHFRCAEVEIAAELDIFCACTLQAFTALKPKPPAGNRRLDTLYEHFVRGASPPSHSAEGDVLALLQLVHKEAVEVLPWIDQNCRQFTHEDPGLGQ